MVARSPGRTVIGVDFEAPDIVLTDRSFVMSIAVLSAAVGRWTRASSTIAVEVDMDVLRKHTAGTAMRDQYT